MSRQFFRWKTSPSLAGAPVHLHPWLADPGSLTARILSRCKRFRVAVLRETQARPLAEESDLLDLPPMRHAWIREVLLLADDVPVVFAHRALSPKDLTGAWHMARAIGSRPLGAALFRDPGITRGPLTCCRLTASHPLHRAAPAALSETFPTLWARRSRFCRNGKPLLVTEVFLPGMAALT